MASKPPPRPVAEFAVATTDWSRTIVDDNVYRVPGGCGWMRFGQCASLTRNRFIMGDLATVNNWIGVRPQRGTEVIAPPVVFMQRFMESRATRLVEQAVATGQFVVNDVDDWFWGLHPENQAYKASHPDLNPISNIDHYRNTLAASSLVTVSTPFLAEQISEWGVSTRIVENRVSAWRFSMRRHLPGKPIVGWAGSTGHRSGDLAILKRPFKSLKSHVRFHHTGHIESNPLFADEVGLSRSDVSLMQMLPPLDYPNGLVFDIGVIPLTDNSFNEAKSFCKGLEYAAAGIPFVASPSREYRRLYEQHGVGRLAATPTEWVDHIKELMDPEVRSAEAERQRAIVESDFNVKGMAREWDSIVLP